VGASFVLLYGIIRFLVEFFREPDPQLGPILGPFSMGQLLSFLMIVVGAGLLGILLKAAKAKRFS
jgi:phosphatidylglycerol:prolipoprotein diacylglycerol transferase